ncbi:MAG: HD domain-containing protein [Patescibacteria group bacterium]
MVDITTLKELVNSSGVTQKEVDSWTKVVLNEYNKLGESIPDGHAWNSGKIVHVRECQRIVAEEGGELGLCDFDITIVGFVLFVHDIGRLVEAERVLRKQKSEWRHGHDSVLVLEGLDITNHSPLWEAMLFAIEHHSDPARPKQDNVSDAAYTLLMLLRDFDKMAGFKSASKYTEDPEYKRQQIDANWPSQRSIDQTWGEEKRTIEPVSMLDLFESFKNLVRNDCSSYEAYMLQYLAWVFDVEFPFILREILRDGGPLTVLRYLQRQLPEPQFVRIQNTVDLFVRQKAIQ